MNKRTLLIVVSAAVLVGALAISGDASTGAVGGMGKHMDMGAHMTMTKLRAPTPADSERAAQIMQTMRDQLSKYQDYKVAQADGYLPYMEKVPQDVYHFTSKQQTQAEYLGDPDLKHPGSLLYEKKTFGGYKFVGAMYSAPPNYNRTSSTRSYYRKLWIRCGNEKGGVPFRVGHANPGGSRVEGDATDVEGSGKWGFKGSRQVVFELDEIARAGARRMLLAALETEAADYVERHRDERDAEGRALVVHNGRSQGRKLTLGVGTVEPKAPRVNDRRHDEQG
jgi:hypothetical protein